MTLCGNMDPVFSQGAEKLLSTYCGGSGHCHWLLDLLSNVSMSKKVKDGWDLSRTNESLKEACNQHFLKTHIFCLMQFYF